MYPLETGGSPVANPISLWAIANLVNESRLLRILDVFAEVENSLKYSNHPRVVFETASIKATRPETDYNIDALLSRIKTLEDKLEKGEFKTNVVKEIVVEKVETKIEQPKQPEEIKPKQKIKLSNIDKDQLNGKILVGLREIGSEMLWNVIQGVQLKINGNVLEITTKNDGDRALLDKNESKQRILNALSDVEPFEILVKLSEKEKCLDEIDEATERIKKIFGDDIVIIK